MHDAVLNIDIVCGMYERIQQMHAKGLQGAGWQAYDGKCWLKKHDQKV